MTEITNEEDKKEQNHFFYAVCDTNGCERQYIIPVYSRTFERDINNVLTNKCEALEKERILRSFRAQAAGRLSDSLEQKQILRIEIPVTHWPETLSKEGTLRVTHEAPNISHRDRMDRYVFYQHATHI